MKKFQKSKEYIFLDFDGKRPLIEIIKSFKYYFLFVVLPKEIIGGMLDLEPRLWRKGIRQNFDDQRKKVLQFAQWWKPYDITKTKE